MVVVRRMKKPETALERLHRNKVVARRIDYCIAVCMVATPGVTGSAGIAHLWADPSPLWTKGIGAFIAGMIIAYPAVKVLASVGRLATARFAPSWVVDSSDPSVVRIVGSVALDQWASAKSALLHARPGYSICDDAARRFGCTLAAIPRSQC